MSKNMDKDFNLLTACGVSKIKQCKLEGFKREYKKRVIALGGKLHNWLSATSYSISYIDQPFHDDTFFSDGMDSNYEMVSVRIESAGNCISIVPLGLFYNGVLGGVSMQISCGKPMITKEYFLFMKHNSIPSGQEWILVKGADYSGQSIVITEEFFFNIFFDAV